MTAAESKPLLRQKHPNPHGEPPLDAPFTATEKKKVSIAMVLFPSLFWFLLLYVGGFIRTYPSMPTFFGLWLSPCVLTVCSLVKWSMLLNRPRVLRERYRRSHLKGTKPGEPLEEKQAQNMLMILGFAMNLVSAYDAAGTDPLPTLAYATGSALVVISMVLVTWVLRENAWAAVVVYKQQGQELITTGPYSIVRHPFYTFYSGFLVGMPLMIGSYWGIIPGALCIPTLMWRAHCEEDFLVREFGEDYKRYQQSVPYRMFPGIF